MPDLTSHDRARLLLALTPLVPFLVVIPGMKWLLPLVAPLTVYVWFSRRVRFGDYLGAWTLGMVWGGLLSLGVILLVYWLPETAARGILNGEPYREEMFGWIRTGDAPENRLQEFLPTHLLHLAAFVLLTWATGGYLGLALGALLVAYMSYFVGAYAAESEQWLLGPLVAWVPWAVLRVAAFVLLGVVFSRPVLVRRLWPLERREALLVALALTGILGDVLIKWLTAPAYGVFLRQLAGW